MDNPSTEATENSDNQTVFTIKNSEISKTAVTQCKDHAWKKLSETELYCPKCQSAIIVNDTKSYA
jgi:Zn finger protein HypA/HybF involved in hydrogenase expression